MSCHEIGPAMGFVAGEILREYDAGNINFDTTKRLLNVTNDGVFWCDGNSYEWSKQFDDCRCGRCLKVVPVGKSMYPINTLYYMTEFKSEGEFEYFCEDCVRDIYKDKTDELLAKLTPGQIKTATGKTGYEEKK